MTAIPPASGQIINMRTEDSKALDALGDSKENKIGITVASAPFASSSVSTISSSQEPAASFSLMSLPSTAISWIKNGVKLGVAAVQFEMGRNFAIGRRGAVKDEGKAVIMYRMAAEKGHANAQYFLGKRLATGKGVEKNDGEACIWLKKAVDQGHIGAMTYLGGMHGEGRGVVKD